MNNYEVILMFYPDAESERREKQYDRLKTIIADHGTIKSEDEWGTRKLAYEIEDYKEASTHSSNSKLSRKPLRNSAVSQVSPIPLCVTWSFA